jgi:YidC/Oxa1 family membrane protein insertase
MAVMAASRQGVMSLTRGLVPVNPAKQRLDAIRSISHLGLASRPFSVKACSSPPPRPSIRSLYGTSALQSVRLFSLWPNSTSSQADKIAETSPVGPSPDAIASQTEQSGDVAANASTPDVSAFETATGPAIYDMETDLTGAVEHVQTLADLGRLSSWPNVRGLQALLDGAVEMTGLPWWATIVLVTVTVRILILPFVFRGQANAIRLQNIQPKMAAYMKDIQYAKTTGNKMLLAQSAQAVQKLMKDNDCSPFRSLQTPLILMPLFGTFFFALKGLGSAGLTSMQTGGLSWFTDLTVADPYYILPAASVIMSLIVIETGAEMGSTQTAVTPQAKVMRNVFRVLIVGSLAVLIYFPAAIFCYMATNNVFSLAQLLLLNNEKVRKRLNLPKKIVHEPDEEKGKPMGFWDSLKAGSNSQTSANVTSRARVPSALKNVKTNQQIEKDREAALKQIMERNQSSSTGRRPEQPTANAYSAMNPESASSRTQSAPIEGVIVEEEPYNAEEEERRSRIKAENDERLSRIRAKEERILARQRRQKKH